MMKSVRGVGKTVVPIIISLIAVVTTWAEVRAEHRIVHVGACATPNMIFDVVVADSYAYGADLAYGVQTFDISDPTAPIIVGSCNTSGLARAVYLEDKLVFVSDDYGGVDIIDISEPSAPYCVGYYRTNGGARDLQIIGDLAYVALYGWEGDDLLVLDISDPSSIERVSNCYVPHDNAVGVTVSGNYAFVAGIWGGMHICDISDPLAPYLAKTFVTPDSEVNDIAISNGYAYVADGEGLTIINVSNPLVPYMVGRREVEGLVLGIAILGNYLFLAAYNHGIYWFDIQIPKAPKILAKYNTPGAARNLTVDEPYLYVADRDSLLILRFDCTTPVDENVPPVLPQEFVLRQNYPNPFNPSTTLEYSLPERAQVNISIYNLLGRRVTTLVDETMPAGTHRVVWDGRDEAGNSVATGIYLYRVRAGEYTGSRKMVLLK